MSVYLVELDGNDCSIEKYYTTNDHEQLLEWVREDLEDCGGCHADIYKEVSSLAFIGEVEI